MLNRRWQARWVAALVSVIIFAAPSAAYGTSNFGGWVLDNHVQGLDRFWGTRASIQTPEQLNWLGVTGLFLSRVDAEDNAGNGTLGLYQGGIAVTSSDNELFDNCGSRLTYHRFVEWKPYSSSVSDYECNWFGPPKPLEVDIYNVDRLPQADVWQLLINGTQESQTTMNFVNTNLVVAGDEFNTPGGETAPVSTLFGKSGTQDWQRLEYDLTTWHTIQSSASCPDWNLCDTDGQWSTGALPTPFTVSHP